MITQNRNTLLYIFKDRFRHGRRKIDAAVGTAGFINIAPKTAPPGSVVHPYVIAERHPVRNIRSIIFAPQRRVPFLIGQAVNTGRRIIILGKISGYEIRLYQK